MGRETTRRTVLRSGGAVAGAAALASTAGCVETILGGGGGGGGVTVGSKKFTEQELLGYMALEGIEGATDVSASNEVSLGGTVTNFESLKSGEISLYWEYTGTAWATLPPKHSEVITDPQEIYEKVESEFEEEYNITFLERAPFNNTYVLTANPDWAEQTGITTISGLAEHVKSGNTDFTMVMNSEFQNRDDGWPGLTEHYGFADAASNITIKNIGSGLTYQTVGQGDAQVGMGFNTNPKILKFDLKVLEDDEKFFPVYNPAPMVDQATLENNQAIKEPLNATASALTTDKIRNLNRRVSIGGEDAQAVAKEFLTSEGII